MPATTIKIGDHVRCACKFVVENYLTRNTPTGPKTYVQIRPVKWPIRTEAYLLVPIDWLEKSADD